MSTAAEQVLDAAALDEAGRLRLSALLREEPAPDGGLIVFSALMRDWLERLGAPQR